MPYAHGQQAMRLATDLARAIFRTLNGALYAKPVLAWFRPSPNLGPNDEARRAGEDTMASPTRARTAARIRLALLAAQIIESDLAQVRPTT